MTLESGDDDELIQGDDHDGDGAGTELDDGNQGDQEAAGGDGQANGDAAAGGDGDEPRKTRKERRAERAKGYAREAREANERAARLEERVAEMTAQLTQSAIAQQRFTESLATDRERRDQPDPMLVLRQRLAQAAGNVRDGDPASAQAYLQTQIEVSREIARMEARAAASAAASDIQQRMPQPEPPHVAELRNKAPWIVEPVRANMVATKARQIASDRGIDFDRMANPSLKTQIVNQAIAEVGAFLKLPVNLPTQQAGRPNAVGGAGARSFPPAGDNRAPVLTEFHREMADNHPVYRDYPPQKRYAAFAKMLQRRVSAG